MEGMRDLIGLKKGTCEVTLAGGGIKIISWKKKRSRKRGKAERKEFRVRAENEKEK